MPATAQDDPLERALERDDHVARLARHPPAGIEDRAEQQQLRAGEGIADLDMVLGHVGHQPGLRLAEQQRRGEAEQAGERPPHSICTV